MELKKVEILPTESTPGIFMDPEGFIKIKGKGMVLDNTSNHEKIIEWITKYLANPAEVTFVSICMEYLNSYWTAKLITILKKISDIIFQHKKLIINWFYEEDDEDILERGEHISESLNLPINFIVTGDIKSCC
ncbi:MAG: SiaC family regulatory phosphoprotein [Bacteroidales bacterium]|nr:SiaC family regulatory phosphoprotein [Bacteroidales bacterium]